MNDLAQEKINAFEKFLMKKKYSWFLSEIKKMNKLFPFSDCFAFMI